MYSALYGRLSGYRRRAHEAQPKSTNQLARKHQTSIREWRESLGPGPAQFSKVLALQMKSYRLANMLRQIIETFGFRDHG
jgi:hypothetical protein